MRTLIVGAATLAMVTSATARIVNAQDTLRLRADNAPVWGPSVALTKTIGIGSLDGPPEYAFGRIDAFAVRADGFFYVYDGQDVVIRMYDASGKFVRTIGRGGSGPGEYQQLGGMGLIGDSVLVTWDSRLRRLSFFDRAGVFRNSVGPGIGTTGGKAFGVDNDGRLYLKTRSGAQPSPVDEALCYARLRPDGSIIDSIPIPPRNAARGFVVEMTPEGDRWNFMPTTITSLYPLGGIISGRTERYTITMPSSGKLAVVSRTHVPVPMRADERAEWDAAVREWDAAMAAGGRGIPSRPPMQEIKPPFRGLTADRDGRVWVEVYAAATKRQPEVLPAKATLRAQITWREAATFDVISPAGQYLGRVALPKNSILLEARGNRIWTQMTGESGELSIVAYRLSGTGL